MAAQAANSAVMLRSAAQRLGVHGDVPQPLALTIVACSADEAHARLEHYTKQLRSKWHFPSLVALGFLSLKADSEGSGDSCSCTQKLVRR